MVTWVINNLKNEHVRSVGIPLVVCIANSSGMASSQIYPSSDSPRYIMGNSVSLAMEAIAFIGVAAIYWLLRRRNSKAAELVANDTSKVVDFKYVL
jgi:hypothetical protein